MEKLIGKKIEKIYINDSQSVLFFKTSFGLIAFEVDGDCCSESWFADIIGVDNLINCTILKVEEIQSCELSDYDKDDGRCRQEEDEVYSYKITSNKGHSDIIFRNSSNGYYGGSINNGELISELPDNVKEIKKDWMA